VSKSIERRLAVHLGLFSPSEVSELVDREADRLVEMVNAQRSKALDMDYKKTEDALDALQIAVLKYFGRTLEVKR